MLLSDRGYIYSLCSRLLGQSSLSYFPFRPGFHNWCIKLFGMYYLVCGIVHIKHPLLLIRVAHEEPAVGFFFHHVRSWCDGSSDRSFMGWSIKLFLIPASAPRLVQQRLWYVLPCLWDGVVYTVNRSQL